MHASCRVSNGYPGNVGSVSGGVLTISALLKDFVGFEKEIVVLVCPLLGPASHHDIYQTPMMLRRVDEGMLYSSARALRPGERFNFATGSRLAGCAAPFAG